MKRILFFSVITATLCYLLFFPKEAFAAASDGLLLWFYTVLPSLLPFLILSDVLIHSGKITSLLGRFSRIFSKLFGLTVYGAYAFLLGLFCGYPMGAKLTADLYRQEKISLQEAHYLLTFSNNASPMFLTSFLLINTLKAPEYTGLTLGILYTSTWMTSLIFRCYYHRFLVQPVVEKKETANQSPLGQLMDHSILQGFETITRLGGYIILFSVGASILQKVLLPFPIGRILLPGLVEITTGTHLLAAASCPFEIKYLWILTMTSFGGCSVLAQTKGMLHGTPLSISVYLIGKIVNSACTLCLGCLLLFVFQIF